MTHAEELAAFVARASYEKLTRPARQQLKIRILDGLGCASTKTALRRRHDRVSRGRRGRLSVLPESSRE